MNKIVTAVAMSAVLVFGGAAACNDTPATTDYSPVEFPDCDADDRSPHWEVKDCGPSPRPMQTAFQPKPSTAKKPTTAPKPTSRSTRR